MPIQIAAPAAAAPADRLSLTSSVIRGADPASPLPGTNTILCVCFADAEA